MHRRPVILFVFLCFTVTLKAQNIGVIHLVNGDRVTGQIVSESSQGMILKTGWNPHLSIPLTQIRYAERLMSLVGVRKKTSIVIPVPAPPPLPAKTKPVVLKKKPAPKPVAKAPAKASTNKKPAVKKPAVKKPAAKAKRKGKWAHDLRMGLDLRYSIVDQQTVHTRIRSSYTRDKWRSLFDWSYSYGESETLVTSDKMSGQMKTDVTFDPGWYLYGLGSGGYDITRRVALRTEFGNGAGYHVMKGRRFLFDGSKLSMDVETGGEYQDKKSTTGISTQKYFWRLGQEATWDPTDNVRISEEFEFYPQIGELVSHRYRVEGNIAYKLIKNLSLNLTVMAEAEPENPLDFEPDDIQIRSSLGWKF
jgi:hypothetical protein